MKITLFLNRLFGEPHTQTIQKSTSSRVFTSESSMIQIHIAYKSSL